MLLPRAAFRFAYLLLFVCLSFPLAIQAQHSVNSDTTVPLVANGGRAVQYIDGLFIVSAILTGENIRAITNPHQEAPYFYTISDDGNWLLYSIKTKTEKITYVHDLTNNGALKQILPFAVESAAFNSNVHKAFFIHSKTFWGSQLAAYDTERWHLLAVRSITDLTSSIAVKADGSQLLAAARSVVRVIDTETLKTEKVNWETSRLKGLVYSPTDLHQYASINHKNIIEVRDLVEDRVLHTIRADGGQIEQLAYSPDGRLISLDNANNLTIWSLDNQAQQMRKNGVRAFDQPDETRLSVLEEDWVSVDYGIDSLLEVQPHSAFMTFPIRSVGMMPIPIVAYSPETSLLLGFGMSFVFSPSVDTSLAAPHFFRPSLLTPSVSYGFNGQLQGMLASDYFSKQGWHFFNRIDFLKNNRSLFFGLGNHIEKRANTVYHNNVFSWEGALTKTIGGLFFAGITYQIRHDSPLDFDASASLAVPDMEGGFVVGIGPVLRFDTRNNLLFPTRGYYVDLSFTRYGEWLGSDYEYSDLKLDYRGFHLLPILTTGTTLAVQALYHGTFNGNAPFYQLPYLSADRILRGVWRNLYIDRQAIALQGELRSNFSNVDPRYGYVVFAGAGDVAPDFFGGYDPDIIGVFGVGLRQQVIPKLGLQSRIDFSVTTKGNIGVFGGVGLTF